MSKLLHCRKISVVLIIIQVLVLILGTTLGFVGRRIHNDLMVDSMSIMPIIVLIIAIVVIILERNNVKSQDNAIGKNKKVEMVIYGLPMIVVLVVLVLYTYITWGGSKEVVTPDTRTIEVDGKNLSLSFRDTTDVSEYSVLNEDGIQYGQYDEYLDKEGNLYTYLHGTDSYCGFLTFSQESSEENVEENKAKEIATNYLATIVEDANTYKMEKAVFQDWSYSYDVIFRRYIKEIPTAEVMRIKVNGKGIVDSYADFLVGCFDNTSLDADKVKQAITEVQKTLDGKYSGTSYEIGEQCVTYKDGELYLKTAYFYFKGDKGGNGVMMDDSIMTPLE